MKFGSRPPFALAGTHRDDRQCAAVDLDQHVVDGTGRTGQCAHRLYPQARLRSHRARCCAFRTLRTNKQTPPFAHIVLCCCIRLSSSTRASVEAAHTLPLSPQAPWHLSHAFGWHGAGFRPDHSHNEPAPQTCCPSPPSPSHHQSISPSARSPPLFASTRRPLEEEVAAHMPAAAASSLLRMTFARLGRSLSASLSM